MMYKKNEQMCRKKLKKIVTNNETNTQVLDAKSGDQHVVPGPEAALDSPRQIF